MNNNGLHTTSGLASVGVYARGKFSGNLNIKHKKLKICGQWK